MKPMRQNGFTLIEMSVVVAIIGILYTTVVPMYASTILKAKETALKEDLHTMRKTIDQFYRHRQTWPAGLNELVEAGYLRAVPVDPLTQRTDSWVVVPSEMGAADLFDIKSGASGRSDDGSDYSTW